MKARFHFMAWGLLAAAAAALVLHDGPVPPGAPVVLETPPCPDPPPPVALVALRTMHETAFFKVMGVLHNRGVVPVGPVVVRGRFAGRDGTETRVMTMPRPEVIVPGGAAPFELVVPGHPATVRVSVDARWLTGEPLPVDGRRARGGEAAP